MITKLGLTVRVTGRPSSCTNNCTGVVSLEREDGICIVDIPSTQLYPPTNKHIRLYGGSNLEHTIPWKVHTKHLTLINQERTNDTPSNNT